VLKASTFVYICKGDVNGKNELRIKSKYTEKKKMFDRITEIYLEF